MPRFSANLTYLFNEKPLLARIAAARAAGFAAIEVHPHDAQVSCGGLQETLERGGV